MCIIVLLRLVLLVTLWTSGGLLVESVNISLLVIILEAQDGAVVGVSWPFPLDLLDGSLSTRGGWS